MSDSINSICVHHIVFHPHITLNANVKGILEKYYQEDITEYKQFSLYGIMSLIRRSPLFPQFIEAMNSLRYDILYQSNIHGIPHVERVVILSFILSTLYQLDSDNTFILLEAAKYHDIGRIDDENDPMHGMRGAVKYKELLVSTEQLNSRIIMALIEAHSVNDDNAEFVFNKREFDREKSVR